MTSSSIIILTVLAVSILLNAATWGVALYVFPQDRVAAILHYNTSVGIDFIGEANQIKAIAWIGTALIGGNIILALFLRKGSRRAATMFWAVLPIIEAILLVSLVLILRLNQ